jgi:predicted nucleic-acid-binding protein
MRAVDTNVLVRLIVRDDARQAAAAQEFVAVGAWVSHVVLVETLWVLSAVYERSPEQLAAVVEGLLTHESLTLQEPDVVRGALDDFLARPALGFADCLILHAARKAGHEPLGTFDRQFAKLVGTQRL